MREINCTEAVKLMNKIYDGNLSNENDEIIQHHCETCKNCLEKYNEIKLFATRSISKEQEEKQIKKIINKKRKKVAIWIGILVIIVGLFASFYLLSISGRFTFLADIDYGISETYTERTSEHPSYNDVQKAMDACIENYPNMGKGTALLGLTYDEEFSFNKKANLENVIAIDFKYIRFFSVKKGRTSFGDIDNSYLFLVKFDKKENKWVIGYTPKQQLIETTNN